MSCRVIACRGSAARPESYIGRAIECGWTACARPIRAVQSGQRAGCIHCSAAGCSGRRPIAAAVQSPRPTPPRCRPHGIHRALSSMRLFVQHHDQFTRQPTVPSWCQTAGRNDPLTRGAYRLMAANRSVNQPAERNLGMVRAPRHAVFHHGSFDAPGTYPGAVAGLVSPSNRRLDHDGQDGVLWLVQQVSNSSGNHIANPSRRVQLDQALQPERARPGQAQRPTDGRCGHALSILDGLRASTRFAQYTQRLTFCPNPVSWTTTTTNVDDAGDQSPAHMLGQPHLHASTDQSYGSGHA